MIIRIHLGFHDTALDCQIQFRLAQFRRHVHEGKEQGITAEPRDPNKSHHTSQGTLAIKTFDFDRSASRSVGCGSLI